MKQTITTIKRIEETGQGEFFGALENTRLRLEGTPIFVVKEYWELFPTGQGADRVKPCSTTRKTVMNKTVDQI